MSKHQVEHNLNYSRMNIFSFRRFVTEDKVLEVEVEPGVTDGYEIPFLSEGRRTLSLSLTFVSYLNQFRWTSYRRWTRRFEIHHSCSKVNRISTSIRWQKTPLFFRHPRFERKNNDLYTNLTITLQDALNGFDISFPHLDGHNVCKEFFFLSHSFSKRLFI